MDATIQQHFSKYGEIETIVYHGSGCAFIEFKESASASATIVKRQHKINGQIVKVEAAHHWLQPVIFKSPRNILQILNDDCLMEIFEYLSLDDLCFVADVCIRFKLIAQNVFPKRFAKVELLHMETWEENGTWMILTESLFRNFALYIKSFDLNLYDLSEKNKILILKSFIKHFSNQNCVLKKLTLREFNVIDEWVKQLQPVFERLNNLCLSCGAICSGISRLVYGCRDLNKLALHQIHYCSTFPDLKFEKLEKLSLTFSSGINDNNLHRFILTNSHIKRLTIHGWGNKLTSAIYRDIGEHLPMLEQLNISGIVTSNDYEMNLNHLAQLKRLKVLELCCSAKSVTSLLNALANEEVPLECLALKKIMLDSEAAEALSKLIGLKQLQLVLGIEDDGELVNVIDGMPRLNTLWVSAFGNFDIDEIMKMVNAGKSLEFLHLINQTNISIDLDDFIAMVDLIKNHGKTNKLQLKILGEECKLNVPDDVIKQNSKWLEIIIEDWPKDIPLVKEFKLI